MKIRMVQCGLKASWMVNIDHILTATDLVTSNTYMDEKIPNQSLAHTVSAFLQWLLLILIQIITSIPLPLLETS